MKGNELLGHMTYFRVFLLTFADAKSENPCTSSRIGPTSSEQHATRIILLKHTLSSLAWILDSIPTVLNLPQKRLEDANRHLQCRSNHTNV